MEDRIQAKVEPDNQYTEMESMPFVVDGTTSMLAPVEIEVLDTMPLNQFEMGEFVQTEAIRFDQIPQKICVKYVAGSQLEEVASDVEEQNMPLAEEENMLTRQFLDGELTFSEFTDRMERVADSEHEEAVVSDSGAAETEATPEVSTQVDENNPQKPAKGRSRRFKKISRALEGLMGEANIRYARGEISTAIDMCKEIIRQERNAPEPYQLLATIYEADQPQKSMQCALIAAYLSPRDAEQWVRLAVASLEADDLRQALTCYSKAIQASPKNIELYETRAELQDKFGDRKAYIRAYSRLLNHLGPNDGENIVKYAKKLLERCMQENLYEAALDGMDNMFRKCPRHMITPEMVNLMMDLLIAVKQYNRCLRILTDFTPISIEYAENEQKGPNNEKMVHVIGCSVPDDLAVDIKAKCIISMIELDQIAIAEELVPRFQALESIELSGDLFLDIAEAYMGKRCFERALGLLEPLVASQNYSLAAVWLRHAECWHGCGDSRKAIQSYEMVLRLSPQHLGARMQLAELYDLEGELNQAIDVLRLDPETDVLDPGLVYKRTLLLSKCDRHKEYFESGMLLLSRHTIALRSKQELTALSRTAAFKQRVDIIQRTRLSRGEPLLDEDSPTFSMNNEPSEEDEFGLLLRMCDRACAMKKYGLLQRMCFTALTSRRFIGRNGHLLYMCLISCIRNNDTFSGFNVVREFVKSNSRSVVPWNLLNIIIQKVTDSRHSRFIMRQLSNENVFSCLHILHANNCLVSGTYKYALNDYIALFKVRPNPLLALLISVTLLQMACQKFSSKKNQLVAQALAFMNTYATLREEQGQQESDYNMARVFHQLGLLPAAMKFYKKVLESPQPELVRQNETLLDLKREAAFNLHLIYLQSGNQDLARMYIEDYIVV
ncbi:general transcription factor 3C polypeptide 3 [Copidosoma floridanum]|uniref:general transcription factor 3C polypeptide 3 n=1 Tax=Copidosoma floridanum TaxID=29053 RepID=UPI0006C9C6F0|nr:general transcription factor 3C polypeptide 3 [Copidosoma floridanum]